MKAAIYARYSSDHQREASLEDQERRRRQEADRAGYLIVQVWSDAAISGAVSEDQRPGLAAMVAAAKAREAELRGDLRGTLALAGPKAKKVQLIWLGIIRDLRTALKSNPLPTEVLTKLLTHGT